MLFHSIIPTSAHTPITTFSIFRFPLPQQWWAFTQMGLKSLLNPLPKGILFGKMLGCGRQGFSLLPDFSHYALIAQWKNQEQAERFFASEKTKSYLEHTTESYTIQMTALQSHGLWDRQNPFTATETPLHYSGPIVVLTRASIRINKLLSFWRHVPQTQRAMQEAVGLQMAVGVGEVPIVQQATISIWENVEAIKKFAYQSGFHKEVVKKTRQQNWYQEELFARFIPIATAGSYFGKDPVAINSDIHLESKSLLNH
ncbi:spheroidene monooxygenase [Runella sp.]|uniref:spheroidene monooxygenase n=1 Tax=Runella sp. TaxID=1960881 RepID=UPI003D0BA4E1